MKTTILAVISRITFEGLGWVRVKPTSAPPGLGLGLGLGLGERVRVRDKGKG